MSTPIKPHAVGTPVVIVRAMRVMNDPANPIIIGKIGAKLEPWQGEPRYTLEGNEQLAYFHREIFDTREKALDAVDFVRTAEMKRVSDAVMRASKAIMEFEEA